MTDGFPNKPKILRGAFVEFGLSLPPLLVVFQFNPVQLTRNRGLTFTVPGSADTESSSVSGRTLREFHRDVSNLLDLQNQQLVTVEEQTIGFDIRLDATDKLDDGDTIAEQFGIAAQIATLELMVTPKDESLHRRRRRRTVGQARTGSASPAAPTRRWCCSSSAASVCFR